MKHTNSALAFALTWNALLMTETRALHLDVDAQWIRNTMSSVTEASASSHAQVASHVQAQGNFAQLDTTSIEDDITALEEKTVALQALNDDLIEAVAA